MVYRFIEKNHSEFGMRWLFRRLKLSPNAYYNYLRKRKSRYLARKKEICNQIERIYHETEGRLGYRSMAVFLARKGIFLSKTTVHKYMNKELVLTSIVRRKKPGYVKGKPHKIFSNLLNQNFCAAKANKIWCTDFTYLFLKDGRKRYNCSIIDLYDRSIVASMNGKEITSRLAIETLKKAISAQSRLSRNLILHSDQGSQFTSKEFVYFCATENITQSMSRAGCPYDNAPMERYFNTLKNELIYHHSYRDDNSLDKAVSNFAFNWYNHIRPHSFNGGFTPFEARMNKPRNFRSWCYNNA